MRKVLLSICIIVLAVLVLTAVAGKMKAPAEGAPGITSVSEAAFSMRSTGAENATSRLVGSFTGEHGEKFSFDGAGEVKRYAQNLSSVKGSYSLLQSADGAAILNLSLDGEQKIYSFSLASPEGHFTLTDAAGTTQTLTPVPQ